ncbi:MAG: hypothetical protein ABW098_13340 [Candidatus Thiodiazotropha sp.]
MRIDAALCLVFISCLVGLGELLAGQPYVQHQFHEQTRQRPAQSEDRYRWRPLNNEEQQGTSTSKQVPDMFDNGQSNRAPRIIDYAETPPGLPRGVYRPVEDRHNITPHKDGYRFRSLSPREQERIKRRNEAYNRAWQPKPKQAEQQFSSERFGSFETNRQQDYRFRPDKRLEKQQGRNWGYPSTFTNDPAFTEAYPAPMFRPD